MSSKEVHNGDPSAVKEVKRICLICQNGITNVFPVREMQLGLYEIFEYGLCDRCGALSRLTVVSDLSRYYPRWYAPFKQPQAKGRTLRTWLSDQRDRSLLLDSSTLFAKVLYWVSREEVTAPYRLVGKCHIDSFSRVLDIGCGPGHLVRRIAKLGFQDVTGVDLFVPEDAITNSQGLRMVRGEASQFQGECFDLVMMHYSLEHCPDQRMQLNLARNLLAPEGTLLIRQPLCDSEAFRRYRANWYQIDAPRHAVIHSVFSMKLLADQCGLTIKEIAWDSTDRQFWCSEQYALGIPLEDEKSYLRNPQTGVFSSRQIAEWKKEAARFNRSGIGDQAVFYLGCTS